MKPKWTVEDLELAIDSGRRFGNELLVGDALDVIGDVGNVATVYFHFDPTGKNPDLGDYSFTFNNTFTLDENFEDLWKTVKEFRGIPKSTGRAATTR